MGIVVELQDAWGSDWNIAHKAWNSSLDQQKAEKKTDEDVKRLIQETLIPHGHNTPLERVWFDFYIKCPIFVERQLDKYRISIQDQGLEINTETGSFGRMGISQNEMSARYRTLPSEFYALPIDFLNITNTIWSLDPKDSFKGYYEHLMQYQYKFYSDNLQKARDAEKSGVISNAEYKRFREVLRGVLGTSYYTTMNITINLLSLSHIWVQRLAEDAQPEIQEVARQMLQAVWNCGNVPYSLEALIKKHGWERHMAQPE